MEKWFYLCSFLTLLQPLHRNTRVLPRGLHDGYSNQCFQVWPTPWFFLRPFYLLCIGHLSPRQSSSRVECYEDIQLHVRRRKVVLLLMKSLSDGHYLNLEQVRSFFIFSLFDWTVIIWQNIFSAFALQRDTPVNLFFR